ncbi:hypothetical protein [Methanoregula sp.]|uniref:hypothetical protein n=1 Tax=Methanoregula sp. TaxID=2052170 RepID=UPI002618ED6B|nr:hypothetical protein [Methanoregula sp.]MDD5143149.1 hypothetical protein [Methanoregula sp.]
MKAVHLIVPVLLLCFCVLPAAAVIQEVTVKGMVSSISKEDKTITIENPEQYGCSYPASGDPVCSFTQMNTSFLTGSVPVDSALTIFNVGDTVVATSLGGAGGNWIAIAKLYNGLPAGEYVIDTVGNPGSIPTPLAGDYSLDLSTAPDCTTCFGTTCTAVTSSVNILSRGTRVLEKTLGPRQAAFYNGRNDGSSVEVTFVKGEASSATCVGGSSLMAGPQPISVYIIKVVPPIGFTEQFKVTPTAVPTEVPTTIPPTKSGSMPVAVIGAMGIGAALLVIFRK